MESRKIEKVCCTLMPVCFEAFLTASRRSETFNFGLPILKFTFILSLRLKDVDQREIDNAGEMCLV